MAQTPGLFRVCRHPLADYSSIQMNRKNSPQKTQKAQSEAHIFCVLCGEFFLSCLPIQIKAAIKLLAPSITHAGSLPGQRGGDSPRFLDGQVANLRSTACVSLPGCIHSQSRQSEPPVKWRLVNFNGLNLIDRNDVG